MPRMESTASSRSSCWPAGRPPRRATVSAILSGCRAPIGALSSTFSITLRGSAWARARRRSMPWDCSSKARSTSSGSRSAPSKPSTRKPPGSSPARRRRSSGPVGGPGSASSISVPTTAATSSHSRSGIDSGSARSVAVAGVAASRPLVSATSTGCSRPERGLERSLRPRLRVSVRTSRRRAAADGGAAAPPHASSSPSRSLICLPYRHGRTAPCGGARERAGCLLPGIDPEGG